MSPHKKSPTPTNAPSPVDTSIMAVIDEALGVVDVGDELDMMYCRNLRQYIFDRVSDASVEVVLTPHSSETPHSSRSSGYELFIRVETVGKVTTRSLLVD